jgi:NitT/TauT family transport system permease protein
MSLRAATKQPPEMAEATVDTRRGGWSGSDVAAAAAALVLILGSWEGIVRALGIPAVVLPTPSDIVTAFWTILGSGLLPTQIEITLAEIMAGFVIGAASAILIGALVSQFRLLDRMFYPYIVAFQAVPKVAVAPLLVIWFGFGMESKIVMTALIAFFPMLVNTIAGLRSVDQDKLDLMIALSATRWKTFRYVRLPTALPFIFAGLDVGIVLSVIGAIVGEFVGSNGGLGYLLLLYNSQLRIAAVFAVIILLGALGMVLHFIIQAIERRVTFWAATDSDRLVAA